VLVVSRLGTDAEAAGALRAAAGAPPRRRSLPSGQRKGLAMSPIILGYAIGLIALGAAAYAHIEASSYLHHPEQHSEHRDEQMQKFRRLRALKWGAIGVVIAVVILELAAN
jgi:hypothetical protein